MTATGRIVVKSKYSNVGGVYEQLPDEKRDGRPSYQGSNGSFLYHMHKNWIIGPKLRSSRYWVAAASDAKDPSQLDPKLFGDVIEDLSALVVDEEALKDCPHRIAIQSNFSNLVGGYKRTSEDLYGYPVYLNAEDGKYFWHKVVDGTWLLSDGEPNKMSGIYLKFSSTTVNPSGLSGEAASIYEVTWEDSPEASSGFIDGDFPPNESSLKLTMDYEVQWIRALDFRRSDPVILWDMITPSDLLQGGLGNCWLLAAIACLAEHAENVEKLFVKGNTVSYDGNYTVELYCIRRKKWFTVEIDDNIPCHRRKWFEKDAVPVATRTHRNQIWTVLLEKAMAKALGSYASLIGGQTAWAWQALTGVEEMFAYKVDVKGQWLKYYNDVNAQVQNLAKKRVNNMFWYSYQESVTPENLFEIIKDSLEARYLLSSSIILEGSDDTETIREDGLVESHAYSLLSAVEDDGLRLVCLRNPWGNEIEWNGAWSNISEEWNARPRLAEQLGIPEHVGDGLFWMAFEDFSTTFNFINICPKAQPQKPAMRRASVVGSFVPRPPKPPKPKKAPITPKKLSPAAPQSLPARAPPPGRVTRRVPHGLGILGSIAANLEDLGTSIAGIFGGNQNSRDRWDTESALPGTRTASKKTRTSSCLGSMPKAQD